MSVDTRAEPKSTDGNERVRVDRGAKTQMNDREKTHTTQARRECTRDEHDNRKRNRPRFEPTQRHLNDDDDERDNRTLAANTHTHARARESERQATLSFQFAEGCLPTPGIDSMGKLGCPRDTDAMFGTECSSRLPADTRVWSPLPLRGLVCGQTEDN